MTTNPMAEPRREELSPAQQRIAAIWQALLGVEVADGDRDFFELGGDRAGAVAMAERVTAEFGTAFGVEAISGPLTVGSISSYLAEQAMLQAMRMFEEGTDFDVAADLAEEPGIPVAARDGGPLPMSFAQQRLWFLDQLDPGRAEYLIPIGLRITGALDAGALRAALSALVARHEVLRTRFVADEDGQPAQLIDAPSPVAISTHDLRHLAEPAAREESARRILDDEAFQPVDLARGPMLRAVLVRVAEEEHLLAVTVHHIVFDGWSTGILSGELTELYALAAAGAGATLPAPALQYADFALWQRQWLSGDTLERQLGYWRERLTGVEPLELPTDHRRPAQRSGNGAEITFTVPAELLERARALAAESGASLFMTLLAAFQLLLAKYSGQQDIAVGTPIAGRNRAEIEEMIGFFINTLVMRTDLSGDPSFGELVARVKETALGAYDHQDLPFERIVEDLAPERDLSRNPFFQTMFLLQNVPDTSSWKLAGLSVEPMELEAQDAKFDFSWYLTEAPDGSLDGMVVYATDLFEAATMHRLVGHFQALLATATAAPERRLSELELLTAAERRQLLVDWNGAKSDRPDEVTIHQLFEQQVELRPDAIAVSSSAGELTYRQLNERANRLAHHLRGLGLAPGTPVGVCLERGPDLVCALLGILKAGAAYLPLDPEYPAERLSYMVADSAAALIVAQRAHSHHFPSSVPQLLVDQDWPAGAGGNPEPLAGPGDLAYLIYTSGSTGRPKGVQIEHGALRARMRETVRQLGLTPEDRVLQFASVAFDSSVGQTFAPLSCGASVALRDAEWDPAGLAELIRAAEVTVAWLTPTAFAALTAQLDGPGSVGPALRLVRIGGEALQQEQVRQWFERCAVPLVNGYGPSEGAQEAATALIERPGGFVPIGRPVANTEVILVDRDGHPVPVGVPGEILISCPGLARGYLNQPELTAEKFTEYHLDGVARRVYRTGDLAKWHPDGQLEFVGRADNQVKLRGYRIELGEIEAALADHPQVDAAIVLLREDTPGDHRIVAYLIGADGVPGTGELRTHLQRTLPDYMVPAVFVALERFPLNPNGKIDRRALPAPDSHRPELDAAYTAPRTSVEQTVTAIWSEVLGVDTIGVHDNFFHLGGHSLLATQVTSRLRKALGVELPVRALFTGPTPAQLAAAIEGLESAEASRITPAVRDGRPLPLSFAQQRLWFLDQLDPGRAEYLIPFALRITGALDTDALRAALRGLVARHEVLRTRFSTSAEGPAQLVDAPAEPALACHDLRRLADPAEREAAARQLVETEAFRPIELSTGPMIRALLIRLSEQESILAVTVHHIAFDGWSVTVLSRELTELYTAARQQRAAELPALAVQYADYARWQREWLTGDTLERQLAYWRTRLAGVEPLELPTDHRRPAQRTGEGATIAFAVPAELNERLKSTAAGHGASLFMTLLAAFQLLLAKYSGQQDITVGTPIAGRNRAELEELIGFFVNTLVLRTDLSGDPTFAELLDRVKETALGAYEHQDLPFERLVEELAPQRDLSRNPLFQTMFVLQNVPDFDTWQLPGLAVAPVPLSAKDAKFDLAMYLSETADGSLEGAIVYSTDLFEPHTMQRLAEHFQQLLTAATARPQDRLSELDLLGAAQRKQILVDWNDTATAYPDTATIHQLFEERAGLDPEATAVTCGADTLSYRQLNERANQLAHHLRGLGLTPDTPVGVCLERGPDLICALLGILKAGAAYLPLDPEHPADRLAYLVEDTATPLVITHTAHTGRLPAGTPYLALDRDRAVIAGQPVGNPTPLAGPDDLCYLIYTSGSTGRPKGVRIEHGGVVNYLAGMQDEFPIAAGEGFLQATPLSFDVSAYEIFWPLWRGANVVLVPGSERLDMTRVTRLMRDHRIVGLHFVPSLLDLFVTEAHPEDCTHLRYAFASGEPLQPTLVSRFVNRFPGDLINLYGATEVSVDTTFWRADRETPTGPVLAGRPMINQTVYVLDQAGRPVPPGVLGEVYLGGASVGRGYHNRPELTAERFLPDPFAAAAAAGAVAGGSVEGGRVPRMYRTGDLGRFTASGELDLLGRVDRQVKLRGVRIELGEIEAMLLGHETVGSCAVIVREDSPGEKRLVAYCVAAPEQRIDPAGLRAWAGEVLPRTMVPSAFVLLDELPLSANGKVDHKVLPVPDATGTDPGADFVAPRDEIETAVAEVMGALLKLDRVGIHDNFFELGGHSLLATQLVNRIETLTGVRVSLRKLFLVPTVVGIKSQLLELLEELDDADEVD
ncbi:non-ribosomal peptide synthetase [Kitasatospora sp. NBC_01266]|uniref:non-ribosomal peptide synthetase n=1 Tax=Kitasatospora sp. NBC_01266 TaxID=2903572 RepID=UPI002E33C548|nr:non-ribosomal peptide synthetase [Kitasatospora sp. NBC_01266]